MMRLHGLSLGVVALVVLCAVSCGESVGPASPFAGAILSALSSTSQTRTVGDTAESPEVAVRDSTGRSLPGVRVFFRVLRGSGTISASSVVSNSAGVARLEQWVLGKRPELNVVVATAGSRDTVLFEATTAPGPLASIETFSFDVRQAPEGSTLTVRPRVRLKDAFANALAGVEVRFAVTAGGGSLASDLTLSDSAGIAESGSWTLGGVGVQEVVARAGSLVSEPFSVVANPKPFGCESANILLRTMIAGELKPTSCRSPDGRIVALFAVQLPTMGNYSFNMTSTAFDTNLELRNVDLQEVARNDDRGAQQTHSAIKAVLPAGTYFLVASSKHGSATGAFALVIDQLAEEVRGCEEVFVVRNLDTWQTAGSVDCQRTPLAYSDRYSIYMYQGMHVKLTVEDWSYTDPNIEFITGPGTSVFGGSAGFYVRTLTYTAERSGYYTFHVGLGQDDGQDYKLIIR